MVEPYDLIIVGGGLVGTSLACALKPLGYRIAIIEAKSLEQLASPLLDTRTLALSLGTQRTFSELGIWSELSALATPIQHIHVSDRGHFGATRLHADRYEIPAFGYVVPMPDLQSTLQRARETCEGVTLYCPAQVTAIEQTADTQTLTLTQAGETLSLQAPLIIAADGANSSLRTLLQGRSETRDYNHMAIVTNLALARSNQSIAYERFTPTGPLAMLPIGEKNAAVIWTLPPEESHRKMELSDDAFLAELQQAFGYRAGRFIGMGKRLQYPLKMIIAHEIIQQGVVFIGNASQQLHPIAGQGFNLGLRDVMALAKVLTRARSEGIPLNDFSLLQEYESLRSQDKKEMIQFTEILARVFTNPLRSLAGLRDLGLILVDRSSWLQRALVHRAMGLVHVD